MALRTGCTSVLATGCTSVLAIHALVLRRLAAAAAGPPPATITTTHTHIPPPHTHTHMRAPPPPPFPADDVPAFLQEPQYADMFISPTRLITRQPGEWYAAPAPRAAAAAPASAVA